MEPVRPTSNQLAGLLFIIVLPAWLAADEPKIAAVLQPAVDNHTLAGAVMLVADKEKILAIQTVGFANLEAKKPMQADNVFWIASQSKPITATALMMLVDDGKI